MKYCTKCGKELVDEAIVCVGCGCAVEPVEVVPVEQPVPAKQQNVLVTVAKVFMVIGTVANAFYAFLIPLIWCLPMTVVYFNKTKNNQPIGLGFKICCLIFVNTIAGILMLCDQAQNNKNNQNDQNNQI